jgi:dTDP-4-amino-4,6-dideoxygalactose transaminase
LEEFNGKQLILPQQSSFAESVWHLFVVRSHNRSPLQENLKSQGVNTLIHYPIPPHLQTAYQQMGFSKGSFPIAEKLANEVLSFPIGPHMTAQQLSHVINSIKLITANL